MEKQMSRKEFLKGSASGAIGIGALGLLGSCASLPRAGEASKPAMGVVNAPRNWDYTADVIVIGTGTSCYGSIKLADKGLSVIALDSYATAGGATGISGGMQWLPNNRFARELGDSRERALAYVKAMRKTAPITDAQCEAFVDNAGPMLDYIAPILESTSVGVKATQTAGFGDFYANWKTGMAQGRTVDFRKPGEMFGATNWRKAYLEAQEKRGVQFALKMKATKFVYRFSDEGVPEILGVIAEKDGRRVSFKANKGVILATGGFDWNNEMCFTYLAVPTKYACSLNTNDGTGLKMAQSVGANLCNMTETFGHITYREKADEQVAAGLPVNIMYERMMPRQIIVNSKGRRFFNESTDYDSSWRTMASYRTYGDHDLENVPAWIIMDRKHVDDYGFKVSAFIGKVDSRGVPPYFKEGKTLRELAVKCGIDPDGLESEVAKFNGYCEKLHDPDYHRGENPFEWNFFSDTSKPEGPARNLGPLTEGPFYAGELAPAMLGTNGGPKLNEHAQVIHVTGKPVARLYACGNCSGFGGPGPGYGGAGGTIGPGLVMGYLAANHILANLKDNWDGSTAAGVVTKLDPKDAVASSSGPSLDYVSPDHGKEEYKPGTYKATAKGMGTITVTMTFTKDAVAGIKIDGPDETEGIGKAAIEKYVAQINKTKSIAIDAVSGATVTTKAVYQAIADCIAQAKAK